MTDPIHVPGVVWLWNPPTARDGYPVHVVCQICGWEYRNGVFTDLYEEAVDHVEIQHGVRNKIPGITWTWELLSGMARVECEVCGLTIQSGDFERLKMRAVEHSTAHLYAVNPEAGPQAGNPELAVRHKITYRMSHFADPAYTFNGGRAWCQCGWNTSGTNERDLMEDVRIHMATTEEAMPDQFVHADGTPWFPVPTGMHVRRAGPMTEPSAYTAWCTRCGWDVDSRNDALWDERTAAHICAARAPINQPGLHHTMTMWTWGDTGDRWTIKCSRCPWFQVGDNATGLMEVANIHAASHTDEPTLGADVHYQSHGTPNGEYAPACRTAKVTHVGPSGVDAPATINAVSLAVFNPDGIFLKGDIPHDEVHRAGGTWHWPHD